MKTKQNRLRLIPAPCFQALMHVAFQRNASKIDAFLYNLFKKLKSFRTLHIIIIKFGYIARCHWLKERALLKK